MPNSCETEQLSAAKAVAIAPYACSDSTSRGREYQERKPSFRSEYQRDRDRIIHSAAFRRLEYKTQVFVNHEGDLYRTRLTHSLEVAQIARTIARALGLNEDLTETIALAHDLGHPPFGHAGQEILADCMREHGGFEHNMQSLRVVDKLEERYAEFRGLNLTFESKEGILKHCSHEDAKSMGELGVRFLDKSQPGLEAQLVNLADEIAYVCHDVDDGLRAGLIKVEELLEQAPFGALYKDNAKSFPSLDERRLIHESVRQMVNHFVMNLIEFSWAQLEEAKPQTPDEARKHASPLISHNAGCYAELKRMKSFLYQNVYTHTRILSMKSEAKVIIESLFDSFMVSPDLLPLQEYQRSQQTGDQHSEEDLARVVTDYIAGMTDRYASMEFQRIQGASLIANL